MCIMFSKLKSWLIERWEIVVAFFGISFVAFLAYLRSKDQKEILDYTNKSHEKELQVNSNAEKDLVSGIQEINDTEQEKAQKVNKAHKKKKQSLKKEKEEFIDAAKEDDDLAEKLAKKLGADFVD